MANNVSGIVLPAPKPVAPAKLPPCPPIGRPIHGPRLWAPVWFYSALGWLGKGFYDANHTQQHFATYLAGSDVDPDAYGATRLFLIVQVDDAFQLTIAPDVMSLSS